MCSHACEFLYTIFCIEPHLIISSPLNIELINFEILHFTERELSCKCGGLF